MLVLLDLSDVHCGKDGGKAQIALFEIGNRQHDLFAGLSLAHIPELSGQLRKFCGVGGIVAHHVLHQGDQLGLGIRGAACAVAAAAFVAMAVLMTVGVGMGVDMIMGMIVSMLMVVIMAVCVVMRVGMMLMGNVMGMHVIVGMFMILAVHVLMIVVMVMGNIVFVHIVMIVFVAHKTTSFQSLDIYLPGMDMIRTPHKFAGYIIHQPDAFVKAALIIYTAPAHSSNT